MNKKYEMYMVPHSHFDREWYRTFEEFRIRFAKMMEVLLQIFEEDDRYLHFMLDGQTSVLDDYLQLFPEKEKIISKYVREGRLSIGPWYTQPDEALPSGEAIIRNLQAGHELASRLGGVMKIGYLPDSFGHNSQMPQIFRGFDIEKAVGFRGMEAAKKKLSNECIWHSPDGSEVFMVYLSLGYYNTNGFFKSGHLPSEKKDLLKRIDNIKAEIAARSNSGKLLLMKGCDHLFPQKNLPQLLEIINRNISDVSVELSSLEKYCGQLISACKKYDGLKGELRHTDKSEIYPGVLSNRIHNKIADVETTSLLERWTEPFNCMASLVLKDFRYPVEFISYAWRLLLQNHAHDSICGCSTDEVDHEVMQRFYSANQIANELSWLALEKITENINTNAENASTAFRELVTVFNPLPWETNSINHITLNIPPKHLNKFTLKSFSGRELPFQKSTLPDPNWNGRRKVYALKERQNISVLLAPENMPSVGYKTFIIEYIKPSAEYTGSLKYGNFWAENSLIRIEIGKGGAFSMLDKKTGRNFENLNVYEDFGDSGDLYDNGPIPRDRARKMEKNSYTEIIEAGPLKVTFRIDSVMKIPEDMNKNTKRRSRKKILSKITTYISVRENSKRADIRTIIENRAKNHWLRTSFQTGIKSDCLLSESQFDILKRKIKNVSLPQKTFSFVLDKNAGFVIINHGLPAINAEKQADGNVDLKLSLLRCVARIYNRTFYTILENGDMHLSNVPETPNAQCRGKYSFEYAVEATGTKEGLCDILHDAYEFNLPPKAVQHAYSGNSSTLVEKESLVSIEPAELIISCIKKTKNRNSILVRYWNMSKKSISAKIKFSGKIKKCFLLDLNEERKKELKASNINTVEYKTSKHQIVTMEIIY